MICEASVIRKVLARRVRRRTAELSMLGQHGLVEKVDGWIRGLSIVTMSWTIFVKSSDQVKGR